LTLEHRLWEKFICVDSRLIPRKVLVASEGGFRFWSLNFIFIFVFISGEDASDNVLR
jgi:hypothetical protein